MIESISAITLATHDMSRAVRFYRMLEFEIIHGGEDAAFTAVRTQHSRAFGREPAISTSSRNLPSASGPGGDA